MDLAVDEAVSGPGVDRMAAHHPRPQVARTPCRPSVSSASCAGQQMRLAAGRESPLATSTMSRSIIEASGTARRWNDGIRRRGRRPFILYPGRAGIPVPAEVAMRRRHLIVLGGFLGAGKTSALVALARWLGDQGLRVAGDHQRPGARPGGHACCSGSCGIATEEVAGGCFCCRFDDLLGATSRLRVDGGPRRDHRRSGGKLHRSCRDRCRPDAAPGGRPASPSHR